MKSSKPDLLLIYYKLKDNIALSEEEEQVWAQYRSKYPLSHEKQQQELAQSQKYMLSWEQFRQKHSIALAADAKQGVAVKKDRIKTFWRVGPAVAASLLLLMMIAWWAFGKVHIAARSTEPMVSLQVPAQSQRTLTLEDGTKVWLNAGTVFHYPAAFNGEVRIVRLEKGEAFFEVAKGTRSQPFIVMVKDKQIKVLGTTFNVQACDTVTGVVTTTLLEGKVELVAGSRQKTLSPGQQAAMEGKNITVTENIDLKDVTGWKEGIFTFHDTKLSLIMDELARWYGVEVRYSDPVQPIPFTIIAYDRRSSLQGLLNDLEASRLVRFRLLDKKVIVSKY